MRTDKFLEAVNMLKELKEKYTPMAMLTVIENCMEKITHAYQNISSGKFNYTQSKINIQFLIYFDFRK